MIDGKIYATNSILFLLVYNYNNSNCVEGSMYKRQINQNPEPCSIEVIEDVDISQYFFQNKEKQPLLNDDLFEDIKQQHSPCFHPHQSSKYPFEGGLFRQFSLNQFNVHISQEEVKHSQSEFGENDSSDKNRKEGSKNKTYAKNYRQKKKELLKRLQQENRFLKTKIDDLSFRLQETQLQLNKLKHCHPSTTHNFQTAREAILKEISQIIQGQEQCNTHRLIEVQTKLKKLNAFDSKHKMNLLNYFMSELLENLINDIGFYFVDCLVEKKGFWKSQDCNDFRRMDRDVCDLLGEDSFALMKQKLKSFPQSSLSHIRSFKTLWKKLYQDYLNIINQGLIIESLFRNMQSRLNDQKTKIQVINYFKLELYFEKIKYRKDMRQLRESWFHEMTEKEEQLRGSKNKINAKKIKLCNE